MSHELKFRVTNDPEALKKLYTLSGSEWSGRLSAEEYADVEVGKHQESTKDGQLMEGFYLEDVLNGTIVASTTVKRTKGFYKDADKSSAISSVPDPSLIGIKNVTALLVGYVFTHKSYRSKGIAGDLVKKAINYVEEEIIKEHIDKSNPAQNDNFKSMVMTDGRLDRALANYYLSKKYFWYLYSGVGNYYEKFGFKSYPLDVYRIPTSILREEDKSLVHNLLQSDGSNPSVVGKKLKLLHGSKKEDRDLISFILQSKELEIVTELNKMIFHSELSGNHKSSSSLTNVTDVLSMSKGSSNELSSITELSSKPGGEIPQSARRKSSIHRSAVPKFAVKPTAQTLNGMFLTEEAQAKQAPDANKAVEFSDIKGAIFTNELQQKKYHIIWATFPQNRLFILSLGELKFDVMGSIFDPTGAANQRRRGSSFTGLNELGGFNFQDLDILIHTAVTVANNRQLKDLTAIYVSVNDLPLDIPTPLLHDYFLNYLPKTFEGVHSAENESASSDDKVKFITDASSELNILPMVRLFGSNKHEFDLDWYSNGLWSWG